MSDELTRAEVVAMWLFGKEYARQNLGIRDWCQQCLTGRQAGLVSDFIEAYEKARMTDLASPESVDAVRD
jgi:hypothetical protein